MSDHLIIVPILAVAGISLVYPLLGGCLGGVLLILIATLCFGKCDRTFTLMTSAAVKTLPHVNHEQTVERFEHHLQKDFNSTQGIEQQISPL